MGSEMSIRDSHKSTIRYKFIKSVRLNSNFSKSENIEQLLKRSPKQKMVYDHLLKGEISTSDLEKQVKGSTASLKSIKEKKLVEVFTRKR